MFTLFKRKQKLHQDRARLIYGTSFFLGLCGSLIMYTASTYFAQVWDAENVGLVYACIFASNLVFLLFLHSIIFFFGKTMMFYALLFAQIVCVFFVSLLNISFFGAIFLMISSLILSLLWTVLDSILEDFSFDEFSGRIRGIYLATMNAGLLLGPLLSAVLIDSYGYAGLYFVALFFFVVLFIVSLGAFHDINYRIKTKVSLSKVISQIKESPNVIYIYWISFTLDFFYAILIVFTPIYFLQLGLSWSDIGLILSLALIPFVLLQYPIGYIADKHTGEKELILLSFIIIIVAVSLMPQVGTNSVFVWAIILIVGRIGAALLEVLRDSYFYKQIDGDNIGLIHFFRTSRPIAYITASLLSSFFLIFMPISEIFWLVVACVIIGIYPVFKLKDSK